MTQPRFIRAGQAPAYLGMDRNRFTDEVRPSLTVIPIGKRGKAFDRLELDEWANRYKESRGRPGRTEKGAISCELGPKESSWPAMAAGASISNTRARGSSSGSGRSPKTRQKAGSGSARQRQAELDAERENQLRSGDQQLFAAAAQKYLIECERKKLRSLETVSYHVALLLPYVGSMALADICNDSLQPFIDERLDEDEVKPSTVNRTLEVARTIMNRAARLWRTNGKPWLATAPLIEMLDEKATRRQPYPITWQQQANLLPRLPIHLQRMVLFALSTGARDANVCRLRWEWERPVPELGRSVFVIPPAEFKTNRTHVLILNDVAWSIVEACRGLHPDFVFTYRRERVKNHHLAPAMDYKPVATMNNTAFQNARAAAGLERMRVHDLRHTFGQRLRDAGVPEEDRALLLGHAIDGMPQHYATATIARLVEMANKVKETFDRTTLLRVVNG